MKSRISLTIDWKSAMLLVFPVTGSAYTMDEMVVTGSRVEESVFEAPQAVSTVHRQEIVERNYRTTPEALTYTTGVLVQKTAHGHGSPFIRGLTGKEVLILVDGVRLNNSTFRFGPNQYLATVDPASIERIEVVKGPGSVLYGSDALGGVINIITRKRQDYSQPSARSVEMNLVYGSADNEKTVRLAGEGNSGNFGYWLGGDYRDYDDLEAGGDIGVQPYTGYNEYHGNATFSFIRDKNRRLDFIIQHSSQNEVPRTDKFINDNESRVVDPQARTLFSLQWDGGLRSTAADRLRASLNYQLQREVTKRQTFGSTTVKQYDDEVGTASLSLQADKALGIEHLLSYGLEYYGDDVESRRVDTDGGVATPKRGNFPDGSKYLTAGLYLQDKYYVSNAHTVTTGIRYSYSRARATLESFGELDESYDDITASLRWSGEISEGLRLFAGIAQGFRAPNLDDIAVLTNTNEGEDVPSPGLKSEQSINYEAGLKLNRPAWEGTLTAFYSDFTNLIDRRPGTYKGLSFIDDNGNGVQDAGEADVVQKFNVGDAYIYGVETDARVFLDRDWSVFGSLSWSYGQNRTDNEPVSRIPPGRLLLGARWEQPGSSWWVEPLAEYSAEQDRLSARDVSDPRIPPGGTPDYTLLNLRGGWKDRAQSIDVALNNLTDRLYKVHGSGIYGPGREIKFSYLYRF